MRGTVCTLTALMLLSLMTPFASAQEMPPQTEEIFHTYSGAVPVSYTHLRAHET